MICGGLVKQPESVAHITAATPKRALRRAPKPMRLSPARLVRAVERGVDVDGRDLAVAALDFDDRLTIGGQ